MSTNHDPSREKRSKLSLWLVGAPVVTGALVMALGGASSSRWAGHLAAGAIALLLYAIVARISRISRAGLLVAAVIGPALVACTLLMPGLQGVHRWLVISGWRLHASQLVMPGLLVFVATNAARAPVLGWSLLLAVQGIQLFQPDAGQASSLAFASLVLALQERRRGGSLLCAAACVLAAVATWMRFDPLQSVPFVEDVVLRSFALHWWLGCAGLVSLVAAALAPITLVYRTADPATTLAGRALSAYFAMAVVVTAFGEFPVPLLGFGASSVLGMFFGLAVLRLRAERNAPLRSGDPLGMRPREAQPDWLDPTR